MKKITENKHEKDLFVTYIVTSFVPRNYRDQGQVLSWEYNHGKTLFPLLLTAIPIFFDMKEQRLLEVGRSSLW